MSDNDELILNERLNSARFDCEYSTITLRTREGWLLWSSVQFGDNTLGEVLQQAKKNLAIMSGFKELH